MTIRFAAATNGYYASRRLPLNAQAARTQISRAVERVSNDNPPPASQQAFNDRVLRAALTHFAEHGLAAAPLARAKAQAAGMARDRKDYEWWLGITRTLDRKLAREVEKLALEFACSHSPFLTGFSGRKVAVQVRQNLKQKPTLRR